MGPVVVSILVLVLGTCPGSLSWELVLGACPGSLSWELVLGACHEREREREIERERLCRIHKVWC